MAKPPAHLAKFDDQNENLDMGSDNALVKGRTLKAWMARVIKMIPIAGGGMGVRGSLQGDIWSLTAEAKPFQISSSGKIHPGLVGTLMPTLDGEPLNTTANVLDLSAGSFDVWFEITFSPVYLSTFLSSYTIVSVTIQHGSMPADTDAVKHLMLNTITDGVPEASFFTSSIDVTLCDNGANATLMHYAASS